MLKFNHHQRITISDFTSVCPSVRVSVTLTNFITFEVQRPSQTAAERGEAELRILDFKTTWSEFQKPSDTAGE